MSRTQKAAVNMAGAAASYLVLILLNLAVRSVFSRTLGTDTVGVDTLFRSLSSMLCMLELGIGTGMLYLLYEPVETKDSARIAAVLQLFRRMYAAVICAILLGGVILCFAVPQLTEYPAPDIGIAAIFMLYAADAALSYLCFDRRALINASQRCAVLNLFHVITQTACAAVQILLLKLLISSPLFSFAVYSAVRIPFRIIESGFIAIYSRKKLQGIYKLPRKNLRRYPEYSLKKTTVGLVSLFCHKFRWYCSNLSQTVIISAFLGSYTAGVWGNYSLIISTLLSLFDQIFSALAVSFGGFIASRTQQDVQKRFSSVYFLNFVLVSCSSVFALCLSDSFIRIWIGTDPKTGGVPLLEVDTLILLVGWYYVTGMRKSLNMLRESTGLYRTDRKYALFEGIINVAMSAVFVVQFKLNGILAVNIAAALLIPLAVQPHLIYTRITGGSVASYYRRYLLYLTVTALMCCAGCFFCRRITASGVSGLIIYGAVCAAVCAVGITPFLFTKDAKYLVRAGISILNNKKR